MYTSLLGKKSQALPKLRSRKLILGIKILSLVILNIDSNSLHACDLETGQRSNEFIVSFNKQSDSAALLANEAFSFSQLLHEESNLYLIKANSDSSSRISTSDHINNLSQTRFIEPNYCYKLIAPTDDLDRLSLNEELIQNDPDLLDMWSLLPIRAFEAWAIAIQEMRRPLVAVFDTGIDQDHPDLEANLWQSRFSNGSVRYGYNAMKPGHLPYDKFNHGAHVSGTIAAVANNNKGIAGIGYNSTILPVKIFEKRRRGHSFAGADKLIQALDWTIQQGVSISNHSWSGTDYSLALIEAIERQRDAGIVFVAAAGNDRRDIELEPLYPQSFEVENILRVGSFSPDMEKSAFSNWGANTVQIAAPGSQILSTVPGGKYQKKSGTSMAAPHISGALAFALGQNPNLSPMQAKELLLETAEHLPQLEEFFIHGSILNLEELTVRAKNYLPITYSK